MYNTGMHATQNLRALGQYILLIFGALVIGFLLSYSILKFGNTVLSSTKKASHSAISSFSYFVKNIASKKSRAEVIAETAGVANAEEPETEQAPSYILTNPKKDLHLSSNVYLIGDIDTGEIILSKNSGSQQSIASVSKLMTAVIASENLVPTDIATVSDKALATYDASTGFKKGERVAISDILYPLLLKSSNDAAEIIAEQKGTVDFIEKMNMKAKELGMQNTTFRDPSGLSPYNASTPVDLFSLIRHIYTEQTNILDITKQASYKAQGHAWTSNNQFLKESGYLGGKSGYTDLAKQTNIAVFDIPFAGTENKHIAIIILQSNDRLRDTNTVLKYIRDNISYAQSVE